MIAYLMTIFLAVQAGARACKEGFLSIFRMLAPGHTVSEGSALRFGERWAERWWRTGSLRDFVRRRPNMPADEVRAIAAALEGGEERTIKVPHTNRYGEPAPQTMKVIVRYRSIHEFLEMQPSVREKMAAYNLHSEQHLLARIEEVCPTVHRRLLVHDAPLTPEHMRGRLAVVERLLSMGEHGGFNILIHYLSRTIQLDAKTYYIGPKDCKVYCPVDADPATADPRVHSKPWQWRLHWYIFVSPLLGALHFELGTGTAFHEEDPNFATFEASEFFLITLQFIR